MADTQRRALKAERRQQKQDKNRQRAATKAIDTPPSESLIAFVHIPKTAGGTLKSVFAETLGRDAVHNSGNYLLDPDKTVAQAFRFGPEVRITIGHVPCGLLRAKLPPDTRYITFLREPVERVISHFYRHLDGRVAGTLQEELERGAPEVTNLMTRFLCGHGHPELLGALPDTAVDDAKEALESFAFVGFQDRFDESLVVLQERLGVQIGAYGARRHVNEHRPSLEQVGERHLSLIAQHNQLDLELYEWASARFDSRADELGDAVERLRDAVTVRGAQEADRTAYALQWLEEQMPPGTERPLKELREAAASAGITSFHFQQARRRMDPPSYKVAKDSGMVLVVESASGGGGVSTTAATTWLQVALPPGISRPISEVLKAAIAAGLPTHVVRRAAETLGVRRGGLDAAGRQLWTAPDRWQAP